MSLTNTHINQLIALCKANNQQAQLELYNRYYKAMYNTAFRIVNNSFEAEDIMQESFLTAFTKLNDLKDNAVFGAWLKRIVINNSIHQYKKQTEHTPLDDVLYKIEDHQGITEDYDITNLKAQQVISALKRLKDNYRIALSLHLIEGYDYEEISSIMNISYANCRTMISRAKESLRKQLLKSA